MSPTRKSCVTCPYRESGFVSGNKDSVVQKFSDSLVRYAVKQKGRAIFNEGEPVNGLFFLCDGLVKLTKWLPDGNETIVDVVAPCSILSSPADIGGAHDFSAVAVGKDAEVGFLRADSFAALVSKISEMQPSMLRTVAESLDEMRNRLVQCRMPVPDRILWMLLRMRGQCAASPDAAFKLPLSSLELAQCVHTTPESVSRAFRKFQKEGVISISRGGMVAISTKLRRAGNRRSKS